MSDPIIRLTDLHAAYQRGRERVVALDGVSLSIERGEIFGLLGPNGAGKTTLLSILEGLLRPERGTAVLDGIDVLTNPQAAKSRLGVQPVSYTHLDVYKRQSMWRRRCRTAAILSCLAPGTSR